MPTPQKATQKPDTTPAPTQAEAQAEALATGAAIPAAGTAESTESSLKLDTTPDAPAPQVGVVAPSGRDADLKALAFGNGPGGALPVIAPTDDVKVDESAPAVDFDGTVKAVVVASWYQAQLERGYTRARKGTVIRTTAEKVERGVTIGVLRKLGK